MKAHKFSVWPSNFGSIVMKELILLLSWKPFKPPFICVNRIDFIKTTLHIKVKHYGSPNLHFTKIAGSIWNKTHLKFCWNCAWSRHPSTVWDSRRQHNQWTEILRGEWLLMNKDGSCLAQAGGGKSPLSVSRIGQSDNEVGCKSLKSWRTSEHCRLLLFIYILFPSVLRVLACFLLYIQHIKVRYEKTVRSLDCWIFWPCKSTDVLKHTFPRSESILVFRFNVGGT